MSCCGSCRRDCIRQEKEAERLRVQEEMIQHSLEEKRQKIEAKARVVEEVKCKEKVEHLRKEALRSKLEGTIASLQEKGAVLELARPAADDIHQVGREIFLLENERNNLKGDVNCEIFSIYHSTVAHAEQQTRVCIDERTSFYTGLPSWNVFREIFDFLSPHVTSHPLPLEDEFVVILVRLRLGLLLEDLSA